MVANGGTVQKKPVGGIGVNTDRRSATRDDRLGVVGSGGSAEESDQMKNAAEGKLQTRFPRTRQGCEDREMLGNSAEENRWMAHDTEKRA